jgi:hypothetical protein
MASAVTSAKLACRFTRGCVISSKILMSEMAKKRRDAVYRESEFFSERMNRNVIAPYAIIC